MSNKRKSIELTDSDDIESNKRLCTDVNNPKGDLIENSIENPIENLIENPIENSIEDIVVEPSIGSDGEYYADQSQSSDSTQYLNALEQLINQIQNQKIAKPENLKKVAQSKDPYPKKYLFTNKDLEFIKLKSENFRKIIQESSEEHSNLFESTEIEILNKIIKLNLNNIQLLMLLFMKKDKWAFVESVELDGSNSRINSLNEFLDGADDLTDLEEALHMIDRDDLKKLASKYKLIVDSATKTKLIDQIVSSTKQYVSVTVSISNNRLNDVKKMLQNRIVKIKLSIRKLLLKVMLVEFEPPVSLHDLSFYANYIEKFSDSEHLKKTFAPYQIKSTTPIYTQPIDLDLYVNACLNELFLNENKFCDQDKLIEIVNNYKSYFELCVSNDLSRLPDHLIRFTAGAKTMQNLRLAYDLVSIELKDLISNLLNGHHIIYNSQKEEIDLHSIKKRLVTVTTDSKKEDNKVIIESMMANYGAMNKELFKSIFLSLFINEIFDQTINDVYLFKHQKYPLDFGYSTFYENRKKLFERRLNEIKDHSAIQLRDLIKKEHKSIAYLKSYSKLSNPDIELTKDLMLAVKKINVMKVIEYLFQNGSEESSSSSLIIIDEGEAKFIEVIADGQQLSYDKRKWINFLHSIDLTTEICQVKLIRKD